MTKLLKLNSETTHSIFSHQGPCGSQFASSGSHHALLVQNLLLPLFLERNVSTFSTEWLGWPFLGQLLLVEMLLKVSNCCTWWSMSEHAGECAKLAHAFSGSFQEIRSKQKSWMHTSYCVDVTCWCVWQFTTPKIAELHNHNKLKFRSHNLLFLKFKEIYFQYQPFSGCISWFSDKKCLK